MTDDPSIPQPPLPPESKPESGNPNPLPDAVAATSLPQSQPISNPQPPHQLSATVSANPDANPNLSPALVSLLVPPPPSINPYARPLSVGSSAPPPPMPSFRLAGPSVQAPASVSAPPQFTPTPPNPNLPNFHQHQLGPGGAPPPGVSSTPAPAIGPLPPHFMPGNMYQTPLTHPPNALARPPYGVMPNGYAPPGVPPGTMAPPGAPRYPPYGSMVRPSFPPRPPGTIGYVPSMIRPPVLGIRPPIITTMNRPPIVQLVTPAEKPQTTVYVGKIASTVEDDFILSLLKFCGAVKSWKRAQDPSNGNPKGFGFCEFESAEGVLRALRLLTKFNIDGQELVLNVNQATRDYLECYVGKKKEDEKKIIDTEGEETKEKDNDVDNEEKESKEKSRSPKPSTQDAKKDDNGTGNKDNDVSTFGLVNDEDREADQMASDKIKEAVDERLKSRPLPPPPPLKADVITVSKSEVLRESGDRDSDFDGKKDGKHDDEMSSEMKTRSGAESPGRGRRHDNRSREKDREGDLKREKERELERLERDREREKTRRERLRELEIQKAERLYKEQLKEWESREKDKEYQRKYEKEREKEKERDRKRLIADQEDETDDDSRRRRRRSEIEDKRKRRRREKEEDAVDRLREEEEIAEAEKIAAEKQERKKEIEELQHLSAPVANGTGKSPSAEMEINDVDYGGRSEQMLDSDPGEVNHIGKEAAENCFNDDAVMVDSSTTDSKGTNSAPSKKLGFGLAGSGKRTAVPSVFNQEDDDAHKDKRMRPLVPIDYSTEELQAIQNDMPPNLAAAAEFARLISSTNNAKEEKAETTKDRSRHSHDRHSTHRERDRKDDETGGRGRDSREKSLDRERGDNKIVDAKQLIDMIPKTKDELFSYDINWAVYDKHGLHEKMRPWISRKITEFLGEEEKTLVDYIVSSIQEHVKASQMLELLQSILDEEAEMFVLKMWRMLIFEIKRVETGLSSTKSKA